MLQEDAFNVFRDIPPYTALGAAAGEVVGNYVIS